MKFVQLTLFVFGLRSALCYDISMPKIYHEPVFFMKNNIPIVPSTGGSRILGIPQHHRDPVDDKVYPCKLTDMDCVRRFLSANSECHPSYGTVPEPFHIPKLTYPLPAANMTMTLNNVVAKGLSSARLSTFYYNKSTGNVVMSYTATGLITTAPRATFTYFRNGKESISLSDQAIFFIPSVIFTAVIPRLPNLRLDLAETSAYVNDPNVVVVVGPNAYKSEDPKVKQEFITFMSNIPLMAWEAMNVEARIQARRLIQIYACNFGVNTTFS